jgi:AcrR family transcriptional regulator
MPRNSEEARARLRRAAIELFSEAGFDQTTAAQIAARAGVTERTFFRHFPDKREALFDGQTILGAALTEAIRTAPAELSPIETLQRAFDSVVPLLEENRKFSEPRQQIIARTPALQEREAAKHVALARMVTDSLVDRGVPALRAELAAQAGSAVLTHALTAWFSDPSGNLRDYLQSAFAELRSLSSPLDKK